MRVDRTKRHVSAWRMWVGVWLAFMLLALWSWPMALHAQEADCAEVKIVIEQKLSLERQAFDARMVLRNGLDEALTDVRIELVYLDQNQQPVVATADPNATGAVFFERLDRMEGLTSLNGGKLPGKTKADVHWLIIPSPGAGGNEAGGRMYFVGAKVAYTLAGKATTVDVTPDYVVVRPQPLLALDYFLPTDVYADDAMTPEVEPAEPFTLGVRVTNAGAGVSAATTIESAQPRIVENHQGLLIDFRILGSYVGNEMLGKSLLLDFGDIPGRQSRMGRWVMETSLAGRFVEFDASFAHADTLGGAVTSLIKQVRTHRLVHDVLVDLAGHDDVYDFLAAAGDGYRVYDSAGGEAEVADVSGQAVLKRVSGDNLRLTFPAAAGLVHARVADPFAGSRPIARVVRSDGKVLSPQNFWLSKTRNANLSWSHYLHVFDSHSTGDYVLEFSRGTAGSIAGSAYRDSNGNGMRDAGEPAEGNLGITLKGVDGSGQTILRQAYTDPAGAFRFAGLAPGRYQLEAATVNGWVDGAWMAGSVGGVAQPGLIRDIVLTAGAAANGYLIAKRRPDATMNDEQADLSIAISASRAQLRGEESANVTVTVHNTGEAIARNVAAQVAVPEGLVLQSANASLGSHANGAWMIGSLPKGQGATLVLGVKAERVIGRQDKTLAWPVSVGAATLDPQAANNSALLGLTVLADKTGKLELTQTLPAQARVLMLLSCPQATVAEQAACEAQAVQGAQAVLSADVQELHAVTTLAQWHAAQRSSAFNVLWLHGGADKLDDQALAEIRAAVRRGATLVADGMPGAAGRQPRLNRLADLMGARVNMAPIGADQRVRFPNEPTTQPVAGALYGLQLQPHARRMADSAADGAAVISSSAWGHGQAWVLGFDLLAAARGQTARFWSGYAVRQLNAFTPASQGDPALAGTRLPLQVTVRSHAETGDKAQDVRVRVQLPADVAHTEIQPVAAHDEAQRVEWAWRLQPEQIVSGRMRLGLPMASGVLQVQTTLLDADGEALDARTLTIRVLGLDGLTPQVIRALAALDGADAASSALVTQARQAADAARAAQQKGDWREALERLAALQAALDELAAARGLSLEPLRLDVARWMGVAQQSWKPSATPQPARLVIASGSGQFAVISTAFAQPLQVRAEDAGGNPVAGVAVTFAAPSDGPGASFAGGRTTAQAVTDERGLASSAPLTANATAGNYVVTASAHGLASVSFMLANGPAAAALTLEPVSGMTQSAPVNTAYAQRIVVRVVDVQDQPRANVGVRFLLPETGPSAAFDGAQTAADVSTGADGIATSPAFVANRQQGTFRALISAGGVARPLHASLTNFAAAGGAAGRQFQGTTTTGTGTVTATVSGGGQTCAFNPSATRMVPPEGVWTPLQKFLLPHGLFDFELVGCEGGSEVTVTTTWPDLRGITGYMKYGRTPFSRDRAVWYAPDNLHIQGNTVSYTIRDGGLGDDDLTVNGVIRDPSGPVTGGSINSIPTLNQWALMLLSVMLGLAALRLRRTWAGGKGR